MKLQATKMLQTMYKAAQRVAEPNVIKMEQMKSEMRAIIKLGTGPMCTGSGNRCAIVLKVVGFSHPCFRNAANPNQNRDRSNPQSKEAGRDRPAFEDSVVAILSVPRSLRVNLGCSDLVFKVVGVQAIDSAIGRFCLRIHEVRERRTT